MKIRLFGLLIFMGGVWMAHLGIWSPLQAIERNAEVKMYYKVAFFAPMILIFGAGWLLGGAWFQQWVDNQNPESKLGKVSLAGVILFCLSMVAGGGVLFWLQHMLSANGYG